MKKMILGKIPMKVAIPVLVALLAVGGFIAMQYFNQGEEYENDSAFNAEFEDDQTRESNEAGATGGIEIPGYSQIIVPAEETNVSVNFYNPENNSVYFEISLALVETEEEIYKSKLLSPGQHLYEIELERGMDVGEYDMVITYNTYSMDEEYTPKNGATVNCMLVVE